MRILGLDIGGANLKAAHSDGSAMTVPFELWKAPDTLHRELRKLAKGFPKYDRVGITMTGESCDCYLTKREGVNAILDQVLKVFPDEKVRVWLVDDGFQSVERAREMHQRTASSNWHALASYCGRLQPKGFIILLDIGSTTTDIIPIVDGTPSSRGKTDYERLQSHELIYLGASRTPMHMLNITTRICREHFASTRDLMIITELCPPDPDNCDTADGRPATLRYALNRLARMLGGDETTLSDSYLKLQARLALSSIGYELCRGLKKVRCRSRRKPTIFLAGSGSSLGIAALSVPGTAFPMSWKFINLLQISEHLDPNRSAAACAWALTQLMESDNKP